jgi:hypothetical protein
MGPGRISRGGKRSVPPFRPGEPEDEGAFGGHVVKAKHGGAAGQEDYANHAEDAPKGIGRMQRYREPTRTLPP